MVENNENPNIIFLENPQIINVSKIYSDEYIDELSNTFIDETNITIIDYDADIYTESGLLLKFRKNIIPNIYCETLFNNMKNAAPKIGGRAEASGKEEGGAYKTTISKNGKKLRLLKKKVSSGIVGFYDNSSMFGHLNKNENINCRQTAFTSRNIEKFYNCIPVFQFIDSLYQMLLPENYNKQKEVIKKIDPNFIIKDTVFTTITVNKNFRTALHKDKGDCKEGFGNLIVCSKGSYKKSYTLFPQYGIGIDCREGDFLLMDVHQWHCNAPIEGDGIRLSFVFYLREKMVKSCNNYNI